MLQVMLHHGSNGAGCCRHGPGTSELTARLEHEVGRGKIGSRKAGTAREPQGLRTPERVDSIRLRRNSGSGSAGLQQQQQRQRQQQQQRDTGPATTATAAATTEGPEATARATNHDGPAGGDPDSRLGDANPFAISEPGDRGRPATIIRRRTLNTLDDHRWTTRRNNNTNNSTAESHESIKFLGRSIRWLNVQTTPRTTRHLAALPSTSQRLLTNSHSLRVRRGLLSTWHHSSHTLPRAHASQKLDGRLEF